jgi:acetylornithine deacetylase/succinyl-diaminopimelate desuccinylase-like protein
MRLVPNQTSTEITNLFKAHFENIAPAGVKVRVTPHHSGEPFATPTNFAGYEAASMAMEHTYGKKPIPMRSGGSIPIVTMFEERLGVKSILMGFGLDSDKIHSPDEHFGLFNYFKGIETIPYFFKNFTKLKLAGQTSELTEVLD